MSPREAPITEELAAVIRASRDVVVFLDMDGRAAITSEAHERYPSFARAVAPDQPLLALASDFELRRQDGRPLPVEAWPASQVLRGESVTALELEVRRLDTGEVRTINFSGEPVYDAGGKQRGGVLILHDVSAQRRSEERLVAREQDLQRSIDALKQVEAALRQSEARFRQLANAMPQLVWTADSEGVVDYYNDRVREFMGIDRAADGSWRWTPVLHAEDEAPTVEAWEQAVRTGTPYEVAHRVRRRDGSLRWYLSRGVPVRDDSGRVTRWYGTATDIHDQKQAEEALRRADARKDAFLAMLSHELRNPLAPIRNGIELLRHARQDSPQFQRALDLVDRQSAHLTRLVADLLDVTRIARGKVQLQKGPVDLAEVVRGAAEDHREAFDQAEVRLDVSIAGGPLQADADATRVVQVVGNLLDNALKFTAPGDVVTVSLARAGDGDAVVTVSDTGAGMTADTLERLFEPFEQADTSLDRSAGGLGLGLALVKSLVEMHGGTVAARSAGLGRGAVFEVRLPLAVADAAPSESAAEADAGTAAPAAEADGRAAAASGEAGAGAPGPASGGRRVLIIEDVVDTAESLRDILELEGHTAEVAFHGRKGLEAARSFRPDVVLCDLGLPGLDGYEVAKALRADPTTRDALLVALSGYASPDDVKRSRAAGFDRHLSKPPDLGALYEILASAPER